MVQILSKMLDSPFLAVTLKGGTHRLNRTISSGLMVLSCRDREVNNEGCGKNIEVKMRGKYVRQIESSGGQKCCLLSCIFVAFFSKFPRTQQTEWDGARCWRIISLSRCGCRCCCWRHRNRYLQRLWRKRGRLSTDRRCIRRR